MTNGAARDGPPAPGSPAAAAPVAAIILNYRTPEMTMDCLGSLADEREGSPGLRCVVVDNASGDGSADRIAEAIAGRGWGDWAEVVRSGANLGFAGGNNLGIAAIRADSYLLINSDAYVRPGAVAELLRSLRERPNAGLVGPRLEWPDGRPQQNSHNFPRPATELVRAAGTGPVSRILRRHVTAQPIAEGPTEPDWVDFACILIRAEVFARVGLLDDGYFMYYEDVDFCRRARRAGFGILHWPRARAVHLQGRSGPTKAAAAARGRRPAYYYASRARYYAKFYGRTGLGLANFLWIAGRAIAWAREAVGHKAPHHCQYEARDIWANWRAPLAGGALPNEGRE